MAAFPGSFGWSEFRDLPLDVYGELYAMAVEFLEAKEEAMKSAQGG